MGKGKREKGRRGGEGKGKEQGMAAEGGWKWEDVGGEGRK